MKALLAHIVETAAPVDRRRASRRTIRLDAPASSATADLSVVIQDLSRTGLLIESDAGFSVGETFLVVLPEIGATPARVKWTRGKSFGCEFLSPVTTSAISAALLRTPFGEDGEEVTDETSATGFDDRLEERHWADRGIVILSMTILFSAVILAFILSLATFNIN